MLVVNFVLPGRSAMRSARSRTQRKPVQELSKGRQSAEVATNASVLTIDNSLSRGETGALHETRSTRVQSNENDEHNDVLTAGEVAKILRIHPVTVRLKAAAGQIPGRQIGNRWRFSRERITEWLKAA